MADCVYFIQGEANLLVKIGVTNDLRRRMRTLSLQGGQKLRLLGHSEGSYGLERKLHERFAKLRVIGEWFRPGADLVEFMAKCELRALVEEQASADAAEAALRKADEESELEDQRQYDEWLEEQEHQAELAAAATAQYDDEPSGDPVEVDPSGDPIESWMVS